MTCRVSTESRGGGTVYTMQDDGTGASASVLPSYGFNLFDLRLPAAGAVRSVVVAGEGWADKPEKPGRHGIPVLFPFPNRIREGRYSFGGKAYQLPLTKPPHAIHGFAIDAPWDVADHGVDEAGAFVVGRFQISRQAADRLECWPGDLVLEVRYTLAGRRLTMAITASNPMAAGDVPFGFGIHPYFRLPLDPAGDPARTEVILPATETWVLDGALPTGERRPVEGRLNFRRGRPMAGLVLDDVLTGMEFAGDRCTCRLVDLGLGAEFRLSFGHPFRELVVFTPPGPGGVIAVEPYTQTTDAINLEPRGIDAGLRVLGPGETARMEIAFETAG